MRKCLMADVEQKVHEMRTQEKQKEPKQNQRDPDNQLNLVLVGEGFTRCKRTTRHMAVANESIALSAGPFARRRPNKVWIVCRATVKLKRPPSKHRRVVAVLELPADRRSEQTQRAGTQNVP